MTITVTVGRVVGRTELNFTSRVGRVIWEYQGGERALRLWGEENTGW